jgi:hypothetical protein
MTFSMRSLLLKGRRFIFARIVENKDFFLPYYCSVFVGALLYVNLPLYLCTDKGYGDKHLHNKNKLLAKKGLREEEMRVQLIPLDFFSCRCIKSPDWPKNCCYPRPFFNNMVSPRSEVCP